MFKTIREYYLSELVNLQNSNSSASCSLRTRIESLREHLLKIFDWKDVGTIVFLPNPYYAKITFINYLLKNSDKSKVGFFSNSKERDSFIFEQNNLNATYFKNLEELNHSNFDTSVCFLSELEKCFDDKNLSLEDTWCKKDNCRYLVVEVLGEFSKLIKESDVFIFTPMPGVTVMGFKNYLKLEPVILGSKSVVHADRIKYAVSDLLYKFECGTLHLPLLLSIENYYRNSSN